MELLYLLLALLLISAIASTLSSKIKMPVEIFLLFISLMVSFIPGLPVIRINSNTLMVLFLPPIIFYAAFFTSWRDFVANKRAISLLAVGLVLFTMCAVAITMKMLFPGMPWALCFLFGAIISPTDASSAASLVKKLNIPRRLVTVIEGESLINDATALIAYRYAYAALLTGAFSLISAGMDFLISGAGGIIIGYVTALILMKIFAWLTETRAQNIFSLLVPYITYLLATALDVSAILSVVTAGIYVSRKIPIMMGSETRHKAHTIWETFIYALNAVIFIIIGLQLPVVIKSLMQYTWGQLLFYAAIINLVIIIVRFLWVYPAAYIPRWLSPKLRQRDPIPHWSMLVTLSWIGMRGILSLILVMSLPEELPSGQPLVYKPLLIVFTYSVVMVTLLLPVFTLPKLAKLFRFKEEVLQFREEALARIESIRKVLEELENTGKQSPELKEYIEQLYNRYTRRLKTLESNLESAPFSSLNITEQKIRRLTRKLLLIERNVLLKLRQQGIIHDEVFHQLEGELDLEELRLKTLRI